MQEYGKHNNELIAIIFDVEKRFLYPKLSFNPTNLLGYLRSISAWTTSRSCFIAILRITIQRGKYR